MDVVAINSTKSFPNKNTIATSQKKKKKKKQFGGDLDAKEKRGRTGRNKVAEEGLGPLFLQRRKRKSWEKW